MVMEWVIAIAIYLIPWLVAAMNHRRNENAIFVLNVLLGWTVVGWVIALVWAFVRDE
jgi:hypothetical protein